MNTLSLTAEPSLGQKSAKSSSRFYRPELDVLRFFAFLLVFFHHLLAIPSGPRLPYRIMLAIRDAGGFGVCLFFLLSSYLITELLFREQSATGDIHIRSFYVRRILRIWPLYFVMLFAGYIFGRIHPFYAVSNSRLLAFLLLAGNWYTGIYGYGHTFIAPLWSISLEEQFYLIWPTVARIGRRTGILIASSVFFLGAYVALAWLCHRQASIEYTIWTNSFVQFQYFALGGLIALALNGRSPQIPGFGRPLFFLSGLTAFFLADFVFHAKTELATPSIGLTLPGYFLIGVGCVLLFFAMLGAHIPRLAGPVVYLGKISYGLYVFHGIALRFTTVAVTHLGMHRFRILIVVPVALALTIGMSMLSYQFFEMPFLKLKEKFSFIQSRKV
jgi:peptidoglycan/LPS O-acetylase OafA/YrhL